MGQFIKFGLCTKIICPESKCSLPPLNKGGFEGDLFKESPLTPLFQRGGTE
jgi:hypothetical protein